MKVTTKKPSAMRTLVPEAFSLIEKEPYPSAEAMEELDRELIRENISPGGFSVDAGRFSEIIPGLSTGGILQSAGCGLEIG